MAQVPARLVYTDSNDDEQVIGAFQPQDVTDGNISTFTIDEEARNYTQVIVEGGPTLEDNMPTTVDEFGTSEPEIRVEIDENGDGNWSERARVYPEESGTTNDRGHYKNKNLWGFKKYYGEDSVSTGTLSSTDLTVVVDELLPSGYTAQYPGDITAPSISNYSYTGPRQQAFNELQREYQHFIIFTAETDGSGNQIVKVQPKGYGGTETSFVRGQDAYTYDYWKKNDLKNIISRVNVIGKDSNNEEINLTFQAGSDTGDPDVDTYLTSLDDPERDRFKRIHVDHTIDSSDAQTIAEKVLNPTGTEHGAIEASLYPSSTLNLSVGILDNDRNIDDVYTVVKQKDFFHQGVTYYSFEFEHEATDEQRDKWREHDSERAKVYPEGETDVGNQNVNATTETVQDSYDQHNAAQGEHDLEGQTFNETSDVIGNLSFLPSSSDSFSNENVDTGGYSQLASVGLAGGGYLHYVVAIIEDADTRGEEVLVSIVGDTDGANDILEHRRFTSFCQTLSAGDNLGGGSAYHILTYFGPTYPDYSLEAFYETGQSNTSTNVDGEMYLFDIDHSHGMTINQPADPNGAQAESDGSTNETNPGDSSAGDTSSLDASGSTDAKNVNVATEDKTDR